MAGGMFSSSSHYTTGHSGFTGGVSNFISAIFGVIASLFNSVLALFQAFFGLGMNVVHSALTIVQHFVAMILDIFSGTIGFIAGNFVAIAMCIGAYYAYTAYTQRNGNRPIASRTRAKIH